MTSPLHHPDEHSSNEKRTITARLEPRALRTYTPTQAVLARSAGIYHWTPEGRRLYDFTSGVLVANLGHNPVSWMERFTQYMGWPQGRHGDAATRRRGDQKENPVRSLASTLQQLKLYRNRWNGGGFGPCYTYTPIGYVWNCGD